MPAMIQARNSTSDSDGVEPSRTSASSAYSALARRGFKKVQKALAKRAGAKSFTNLVTMLRSNRPSQVDLLSPDDAPIVEQCPEPDYTEGMITAPESPTMRLLAAGDFTPTVLHLTLPHLTAGTCPAHVTTSAVEALCGLAVLAGDTLDDMGDPVLFVCVWSLCQWHCASSSAFTRRRGHRKTAD